MSARQQAPAQEQRQINFAVATALNEEVLGKDQQTSQEFTLVGAPGNQIIRIYADATTEASKFQVIMKRDGKEVRRFHSDLLKSSLQGPFWAGFPLPVRPGQIQFYLVQDNGVLETHTIYIMWTTSLITVVS